MSQPIQTDIPSTDKLSDNWKRKFALIEKAGGVKYPKLKELSIGEKFRIVINFWGFFFGPIYYILKGMWKKAITFTAIGYALIFAIEFIFAITGINETQVGSAIINASGYGIAGAFGYMANNDYYKKMVLNKNGWW